MTRLIERFAVSMRGDGPAVPVAKLVGFKPTSIEEGKAVFELEAGPQQGDTFTTLELKIRSSNAGTWCSSRSSSSRSSVFPRVSW